MMPTKVISFREDATVVALLKKEGINAGQFAKDAFEGRLRRLLVERAGRHRLRLDDARPIEDIVREMRDRR